MFTAHKHPKDIVKRYEKNPIIEREDIPFACNTVFNAGAVKHKEEYILLLRVETLEGSSCLVLARSKNGYDFEIDPEPVLYPSDEEPYATYEKRGVEDPRITFLMEITIYFTPPTPNMDQELLLQKQLILKNSPELALYQSQEIKMLSFFPER